jgi:hypothetical protein
MTKEYPAPQSEAPTLLLTPFSTHLSFRWTLPLSKEKKFLFYFVCLCRMHFLMANDFTLI